MFQANEWRLREDTVKFPMSGDTTTDEASGRLWSAAQFP